LMLCIIVIGNTLNGKWCSIFKSLGGWKFCIFLGFCSYSFYK
jgi:hypothetical protein